ncbi:MAG TPA: TIGR03557 family F420-dependent LLM class oxidoreductase [Gaiellaceae bacterium]|nr:TIGR03557 family F420-dependent LLM class oxidoreductase [Gaiellaceae bacterium]
MAVSLGYTLSSEEHGPNELVRNARAAEEAGFEFVTISDHFHPWVDAQGQSPFVWSVIGGVAQATARVRVGTGVTCPTIRIHPAIVAQAAATSQVMLEGRFFLGVGTGEELNEHVTGVRWPGPQERLEMLAEAIDVLRLLWQGGYQSHYGRHYTVERARIFTLPDEPPPIAVAASQPQAAELAGRLGDALVTVAPDEELLGRFDGAGGSGKPRYGQLHVCYAENEAQARKGAHEIWPNAAMSGSLGQELATTEDYEAVAQLVREDDVAESVVCGPDPERHLEAIREYERAGFTHVFVHQVGPEQEPFLRFYAERILPRL